ncbi:MAG: sigma-70 family RNA polymerase sigma factor [Planctomycetota bacterium]
MGKGNAGKGNAGNGNAGNGNAAHDKTLDPGQLDQLILRARGGDSDALGAVYGHYRPRLEHMVRLRMDRRLTGRFDASDVLQETFLEVTRRFPKYAKDPQMPLFLWLHYLTGQRLLQLHRQHLGAQMRDASLEISIDGGRAAMAASSLCLAEQLAGSFTSPSQVAIREETRNQIEESLNALAPIDREVIALRHLEQFSNDDVAALLGLSKAAASNRYIRALRRMKEQLGDLSSSTTF